ncbi:MAG TPA: serine hydrolase domain-containing protein [Thermomicrobiales bacterium]
MRARRILTLLLVCLWMAAGAGPMASLVAAQPATPVAGDQIYEDPDGRFSVPVPMNWTVETREGFIVLHDPEDDLKVTVIVATGSDAESGIAAAWEVVDPEFDPTPPPGSVQTLPSAQGVEETVVITYDPGTASGQVKQALGQRVGDQVYILIFEGSVQAAVRRAAQINVIASGFTITGVSQVDLSGVTPRRFEGELVTTFEAYVEDLMRRMEVPGMSVAIVQDGQIVYANGFGVTELGGEQAVTADTMMMIGSVGKSLTTMMMATAVDDGVFIWDTPVIDLYPTFAVADEELTRRITMRNMVCACTGVPRRDFEIFFNAGTLTPEMMIASLRDFEFYTGFGETFQYSNQMVAAAGFIAAAAITGNAADLEAAYEQALSERVLEPIGMTRTTLDFDVVASDADAAVPHGANLNFEYVPIPIEVETSLLPIAPAGVHWSTANDMARYLITEIQRGVSPDGNRVVSEANLQETWQPQVEVDAETSYGLGWLVGTYKGVRIIYHNGNTNGFTSDLAFLPDVGLGIVVLANAQAANPLTEGVRHRLLELVYDLPAEYDETIRFVEEQGKKNQEETRAQLADTLDKEALIPFLGTYTNSALGVVELRLEGDAAVLDIGEFQSTLRQLKESEPGAIGYLAADPPLTGLPVLLRVSESGERMLSVQSPATAETYDFVPIFGPAASPSAGTPVAATPIATPEASTPVAATPESGT